MRKLLVCILQLLLYTVYARSSLSLSIAPLERVYGVSFAQESRTTSWEATLAFGLHRDLVLVLPSRFKIKAELFSLSLGAPGFWQGFVLLDHLSKEQAILYQRNNDSFCLLAPGNGLEAVGYERQLSRGVFSLVGLLQKPDSVSTYQVEWGVEQAPWALAGKLALQSQNLAVKAEMLLSPVDGILVSGSYALVHSPCTASVSYGQNSYPKKYSLDLDFASEHLVASVALDDWFGGEPIYGGFSAVRKRRQSASVHYVGGWGWLHLSAVDTYEFKRRGGEAGTVVLQAKLGLGSCQIEVEGTQSRGATQQHKPKTMVTLALSKATITYDAKGWAIAFGDSFPLGSARCSWEVAKRFGSRVSFHLGYSLTSGR